MLNIKLLGDYSIDYMNEQIDIKITFKSNPVYNGGEYYFGPAVAFNGTFNISSEKTWGDISDNHDVSPLCLIWIDQYITGMFLPYYNLYDNSSSNSSLRGSLSYSFDVDISQFNYATRKCDIVDITNYKYFGSITKNDVIGACRLWTRGDLKYDGGKDGGLVDLEVTIECNAPVIEMSSRYITIDNKDIRTDVLDDLTGLNGSSSYNCYIKNRWNYSWYIDGDLYNRENQYIDYTWTEKYPPKSYIVKKDAVNYSYVLHQSKNITNFVNNSNIAKTNYLYGDKPLDYIDHVPDHEYRIIVTPILWKTNIPIFKSNTQGENYYNAIDSGDTATALDILKEADNYKDIQKPTINNTVDVGLNTSVPLTTTNNVYLLTESQFGFFLDELYSQSFWDVIKNGLYGKDVYENIINVRSYPVSLSDLSTSIVNGINFCSYTMDLNGVKAVLDYVFIVDCGTVFLSRNFNNFYDFEPYTNITLYLPFYGAVQLDCSDYMDSEIGVKYSVDITTGYAVISVFKNGTLMESYTTNISYNISFSASNYTEYMHNIINTANSTVGNIASAIDGNINYTGLLNNATDIAFSTNNLKAITFGVPSAVSNTTLPMFPYVLVRYKEYKAIDNEQIVYGYPSNTIGKIGDFSGFLKCSYVDIAGLPLQAQQNIYAMLKDGIYI